MSKAKGKSERTIRFDSRTPPFPLVHSARSDGFPSQPITLFLKSKRGWKAAQGNSTFLPLWPYPLFLSITIWDLFQHSPTTTLTHWLLIFTCHAKAKRFSFTIPSPEATNPLPQHAPAGSVAARGRAASQIRLPCCVALTFAHRARFANRTPSPHARGDELKAGSAAIRHDTAVGFALLQRFF